MSAKHNSLFKLPRQDLTEPSLFDATDVAVATWAEQLPKANLGETSRLLFQALQELNRVRLHPTLRLDMLEELRPVLYFVAAGLTKHYLNQPIVMPEKAQKVAELSHSLRDQLTTGYILAALHADGMARSEQGVNQLLSKSLHRAITELGDLLLLHTQLYRDPPAGTWLKLHQMMLLAQQNMLDQQPIEDDLIGRSTSVTAAFDLYKLLYASIAFNTIPSLLLSASRRAASARYFADSTPYLIRRPA